jgi:plasmid maintenance system antidote protein VapI
MGTRNLTAVYFKGEFRIAQYGQWDGYISGSGWGILEFLKEKFNREQFEANLLKTRFVSSQQELEKLYKTKPIYFTRDTGYRILEVVQESQEEVINLQNSIDFAADSVFCEYAYVIDLDTNKLEVYEGFQKQPHKEGRFCEFIYQSQGGEEYYPVKLAASYDLDNLPTREQMKLDVEPAEED